MDAPAISSFKEVDVDVEALHDALAARCMKSRVYCKPLLVGWYNELRKQTAGGSQLLDAPDDALAFLLYNGPGYIDTVLEYFLETREEDNCHFVDGATDALLRSIADEFAAELRASTINLDKGPPYFHAQSLGVAAGIGQHLEPSEVQDPGWHESVSRQLLDVRSIDVWGSDITVRQKIFGISMHPEFGGWFAYRGLLVLHGARAPTLQPRQAVVAVKDEAEKKRVLEEYNLRADDCRWRDLTRIGHPPEKRYTPEEMYFFTDMNMSRRRRYLEMKADMLKLTPKYPAGVSTSEKWGANPEMVESLHGK